MAATCAVIKSIQPTFDFSRINLATTVFVAGDETADLFGILKQIDDNITVHAVDPRFDDALFEANTCFGKSEYRHELSAPTIARGLEIQIRAGIRVPLEIVIALGRVILCDKVLVRRMFILHWDTLIIRDSRSGDCVDWRIRDFVDFGGVISSSNFR